MRSKRCRKIGFSIMTLLIIGIGIIVYATQQINISVIQTPNVDIILTKSKTEVDLTNFKENLEAELIKQKIMTQKEIDDGKLNIEAVETQTVESQETLSWTESKSSSIGTITITNNGKDIDMKGNTSNAGKQAMWIIPENNQEQDFTFGYSINFGDSFNAAGMLLRVQQNENGYIEGYMLSFNNRGAFSIGSNAGLWHFIYDGNNGTSFRSGTDINLITGLSINTSGTLSVQVTENDITISGGGLSAPYIYTMPVGESYGNGYGFFSDHYSHGCSNIGQFTLTNIDLKVEIVKKFTEVLQAPDWREGSTRILINVEDEENQQFSDESELSAIIARLMSNDVYYIGWGTQNNNSQIEEVIKRNDNKGVYIANSSDEAIQATVDYLKTLMVENASNVIIAAEPVNVILSGDVETPTKEYPNGVWKVEHDYNYYENPQAQYELDGMYTNELINSFDNVGKYSIYCEDELITEVYAHRRPVASFNIKVNGENIEVNSQSYDLDIEKNASNYSEQKENNGIANEKWQYKKTSDGASDWITIESNTIGETITSQLEENTSYLIKLTVIDYQGVESSSTKNITTGESTEKPIASFKLVSKTISMYESLNIIDESYDPSGKELTYEWKVTKTDANGTKTVVYTGETPVTDFEPYGTGEYKIQLIVSKTVNSEVISSDAFTQTIEVTDDITAPIIVVTPTTKKTYNEDIEIQIDLKDEESGLKKYKYAFTQSNEPAEEGDYAEVEITTGESFSDTLKIPTKDWDKNIYLHIIAQNNAGVESEERIVGNYYIEPTYGLTIQAIDSSTGSGVKDETYNIIGEYEDGTTANIAKNVVTNSNGKITLEKANLHGVVKLKIDNINAPAGYELANYKNVKIDTSTYNIVVDESLSSNDVITQVSEDGQNLSVKVPVDKVSFELKIINKDSETNNLISNTVFVLKQSGEEIDRGTTENGEVVLKGIIGGIDTTKEYVLEQESISSQYANIGNTTLKIKFDQEGKISKIEQKLFASNDAIEIQDSSKAEIIVKNQRIDNTTFSVNINVKANNNPLSGSEYEIIVEGEDNLKYTTNRGISDEQGNIKIDGLYGTGLLKMTFKHISAPDGYAVESIDRYITIERDSSETIKPNDASMENIFEKAENKTVYVNLTNSKKEAINALKIRILAQEATPIEGVNIEVYKIIDDELVGTGKTDKNGLLEIDNITSDGYGDVIYKIVTDSNIVGSNILFTIRYDNNNKVVSAESITSDINVYYSEDNDEDYYKNTANVDLLVSNTNIEGTNQLRVTSQSEATKQKLQGIQQQIKIISGTSVLNVYTTDENGNIELNLPNDENMTIEIRQVGTIEGYKLDSTAKTIELKRNENEVLQIVSLNNIDKNDITIDSNGNVNIMQYIKSINNTSVKFELAKVNSNNNLSLGGVKFKIKESTTGYEENITTDANGYVVANNDFVADSGKSYIFEITELETIYPYKLPENSINMEIRFTKEGELVQYLGEAYLQGNELLEEKKVVYDKDNNELNVKLKIKNEIDASQISNLYDIDIKKVDKEGNELNGSKYDIEIRPYAESSLLSSNCEITTDIEVSNLSLKQDKTTIILKEVNAALGCNLDSDIKVITLALNEEGQIECLKGTTSTNNMEVSLKNVNENGTTKTIVEVVITAEDPKQVPQPTTPGEDNPGEDNPGEDNPEKIPTANIELYNKSYGSWDYNYWHAHYYWCCSDHGWACRYYRKELGFLSDSQKLIRIFGNTEDAINYGFKYIYAYDITLEARLVNNGITDEEIYETSTATTENVNAGTHNIPLYNDYKNKIVEFTLIENVPAENYSRNKTDAKFLVEFDSEGNVKTGTIVQGTDLEEYAIGGISASGIVNNIKTTREIVTRGNFAGTWGYVIRTNYNTYDIEAYNSIGKNTLYVGLLNKALNNPLTVTVNLKDADTQENLNGAVTLIVTDVIYNKVLETKNVNISNGKANITLANSYANRNLIFTLVQNGSASLNGRNYIDNSSNQIQFAVETDDDGNIKTFNEIKVPANVRKESQNNNTVEYTIDNELIYNFAINLTKLDENGNPLQGVRTKTTSSIVTNATENKLAQVFVYGSSLTDENGNAKLKVILPTTGDYKYYGKTVEINLDEYYVPDNYRAETGIKLRVLFDNSGMVKETQVVSNSQSEIVTITGTNNVSETDVEKSSIDITLQNSIIEEKPSIEITNTDVDNEEEKLIGTKYKIQVWDEEDYTKNNLAINEEQYSQNTNEDGYTKVDFNNAHALRTMIYVIQEVKTADSYETNKDIVLRVKYDKDGKIVEMPTIVTTDELRTSNATIVKVAQLVGDPIGDTNISLKIVNELKPKFYINLTRLDTQNNRLGQKEFKIVSKEKDETGEYQLSETRVSAEKIVGGEYEVGFKTNVEQKEMLYTIYELTGNAYTERGKINVQFDQYGNVIQANYNEEDVNYINSITTYDNKNYINVAVKAEVFKMEIQVEDVTGNNYNLSGYSFEITNSKGETSNVTTKTNALGQVIEVVGETYKNETINYNIVQVDSPIDYNDISSFSILVKYDENGEIQSVTPSHIDDVYDLISTNKTDDIHMKLKAYTTPAIRNTVKITLTDEDDSNILIENSEYSIEVLESTYNMAIHEGEGEKDLGSYKKYAGETVTVTLTQTLAAEKYMINDSKIQISVTYSDEGIIEDARIIASDGYVEIDTQNTIGTENLVLKTANRRKTVMNMDVKSTELETDKVNGAEFKIIESGKSNLYSDTKTTGIDGKATLYVGPYYRDKEVTYKVTNTKAGIGFNKLEDFEFTLIYNSDGKVVDYSIPENEKAFVDISLNVDEADIEINLQIEPLFTVGANAIDSTTLENLVGAKYEIVQVGNDTNRGTVITQSNKTAHAAVGKTEIGKAVQYQIIERDAPSGYKFKVDIDSVIGIIEVTYDKEGHIIKNSPTIISGYDYISINSSTDKPENYDVDIKVQYDEIDEFKVIIENQDILDDTQKIQSTFTAVLSNGQTVTINTDEETGIGTLFFGKLDVAGTRQRLIISQSNIQGNYATILPIAMDIQFDESAKIKEISLISNSNYAEPNVAYTKDSNGEYTIKLTVKNNPVTKLKLNNIADGDNNIPINSIYELSAQGIDTVTIPIENGEATIELPGVQKNRTVYYTLKQIEVQKGYAKNKNITLVIDYDGSGRISRATIEADDDNSIAQVVNTSYYLAEVQINNKQLFEIYLEAEDAFDSDIKLSGVSVSIVEDTYSNIRTTLTTDEQGVANTILGSTYANHSLYYEINILNNLPGYDTESSDIEATVRVDFDSAGNVKNCASSSSLIEVSYGSGLAIEIKVKYIPTLTMNLTRRNTTTNIPLNGKQINISSSTMHDTYSGTTNANGKMLNVNAGNIKGSDTVTYTITEENNAGYSALEALPTTIVSVTYDSKGYISNATSNIPDKIEINGIGTRTLELDIGSDLQSTISILNTDYYINTERLNNTFEIKSSKGETANISSTTNTSNVIEKLGRMYSGETIEYTIHQTSILHGYELIDDTKFTVQYNENGTIGNVTSENTDVLQVKNVNQTATQTTPNIVIQINSKPSLLVNVEVLDKQYHSGVEGLTFKVKDEKTGKETVTDATTDSDGIIQISVPACYRNTHVTYTISQENSFGGYKTIPTFQVIVEYGELGTIVENGTYVINTESAKVVQGYSEELYRKTKLRGIKLQVEAETELGIGIEKLDMDGNKLQGVEFTVIAKDVTNNATTGVKEATNSNGEIVKYFGDLPKGKTMEYTISEVQAPAGYRKIEDVTIRVYFDDNGRITSYTTVNESENVNIEVATDNLYKMEGSRETVHIKLKITNNDRVTFKIVNTVENNDISLKDADYKVSVETKDGIILDTTASTDINGELTLENVDASGTIKFYFNQISVPEGYANNIQNSGYITIDKSTEIYKLTFKDSTDDLQYEINSENGIVTIYLKNAPNLQLNIFDVDAETQEVALNATHTIEARHGDTNEANEDILNSENVISYNSGNPYISDNGITQAKLGDTNEFANKKVIYTIKTPSTADTYNEIGNVNIIVEYDSKGIIKTINGISSRLLSVTKRDDYIIDVIIGYGNNDFYTIKVNKQNSITNTGINDAQFNIGIEVDGNKVELYEDQITSNKVINDVIIEKGILEIKKLKYEGNMKITLTETNVPEGYNNNNISSEVSLNVALDKTDPDNILLKTNNATSTNARVDVNEYTKVITITITNDPIINIKLNKFDESGNSLIGMKFNIEVKDKVTENVIDYGEIVTNKNGIINVEIKNGYINRKIQIIMKEEKEESYKEINPIIIEAYINEKGEMQENTVCLISGKDNAEIVSKTINNIEINVVNKLDEFAKPYSININKVDSKDNNIKLANVLFQVKVTPEKGSSIYKAVKTDESGNINISGLIGSGTIKIELKEVITPEGYSQGATNGYFSYEIQKLDGLLQKVSSNCKDSLWNIDNDNRTVYINVENETDKIGLSFEKVDSLNTNLKIKGAELKLTNVVTGEEYISETDKNGIAYFLLDKESNTVAQYLLNEIKAPNGYSLDSTSKTVYIKYNQNGDISNIIEGEGLLVKEQNSKYAKIQITNLQSDIGIAPYNLELINVDRDNQDILIPNAEFIVDINQTLGAQDLSLQQKTDSNGKINLGKINGAGDIIIKITNTIAGEGYIINNNEIYVKLNRDINSEKITILDAHNIGVIYEEETDTIKMYFESTKENNKYNIKINIVNRDTKEKILDQTAKFNLDINGVKIENNANANGQIIINNLEVKDVQNFIIEISEIQAPSGYELISDKQQISVDVGETYNMKTLKNITVSSGNNIEIQNTSNSTIELNILYDIIKGDEDLYLESEIYSIDKDYTQRISPYTTVQDFLANMKSNGEMKVYNAQGKELTSDEYVGTGMTIVATKGSSSIQKTLVVRGDLDGNGKITITDLSTLNKMWVGSLKVSEAREKAADIDYNGKITITDLSVLNQASVGKQEL